MTAIGDLNTRFVASTLRRVSACVPLTRTCRLENAGYNIGVRFLELVAFKERPGKRETGVIGMLQFVSGPLWTQLFGKPADALEKSKDQPNAFMIRDESPITNFFISVPRDAARFNPASFVAGIVRGVLDSAGFVSFSWCRAADGAFYSKQAGPGSLLPCVVTHSTASCTAALHGPSCNGPS